MAEQPFKLTVGGDVQASKGTYLHRDVDDLLYAACLAGKFAYVLACRQIGKSSLKNAVAEQLMEQGIRVARIDLNSIGGSINQAEKWYFSLIDEIATSIGLADDIEGWWEKEPKHSTMSQRFLHFLDEVLLVRIQEQIVIFIDEIDMTLELPFSDDFFASIRSLYNERSQNEKYRRLSFVLLGVATPEELIKEPSRTPFNIGESVEIRDFKKEEIAASFVGAIEAVHPGKGELYFDQIFAWTNGHPYLTQKLCKEVNKTQNNNTTNHDLVEQQVKILFLKEGNRSESNLHFVQSRLLDDPYKLPMLRIQRKILEGEQVVDEQKSPAINRLKLYGLVHSVDGVLQVRNKIYERFFNLAWYHEHYPRNWNKIVAYVAVTVLIAIVFAASYVYWNDRIRIPQIATELNTQFRITEHGDKRLEALAELYELNQNLIFDTTNSYSEQADWLISRLSVEDQMELFDKPHERSPVVIKNQYTELVDVRLLDNQIEHNSDKLLHAMAMGITGTGSLRDQQLADEVRTWAEARGQIREGAYEVALSSYNLALGINPDNYATLYERSVLLLQLEKVENALKDLSHLEQLLDSAIIATPTPATETPTPSPTVSSTPTPSSTPRIEAQVKESDIVIPELTTSQITNGVMVTSSREASVPILTPTALPAPQPSGIIERITPVQLLNAVQRLLIEHPQFDNIPNTVVASYPNLVEIGLGSLTVQRSATIIRSTPNKNRYFIEGPDLAAFEQNDLLVVYAQDNAGNKFDAAVVFVVDKNQGNLIVQVIFQNENYTLDSLDTLQLDDRLDDVDMPSMTPVDDRFVGFMLNDGIVRLTADELVKVGNQLEAVQLTRGGDTLPFPDGPRIIQIDSIGINGKLARVSSSTELPPLGTLLVRLSESPIVLPSSIPSSTPQAQANTPIYESFDGVVTLGWENARGEWGVNNQRLQVRSFADGLAGVSLGQPQWSRYAVRMNFGTLQHWDDSGDVKVPFSNFHVVVHFQGDTDGYWFTVANGGVACTIYRNGVGTRLTPETNEWGEMFDLLTRQYTGDHDLEITVRGNQYTFRLDDKEICNFRDDTYSAGSLVVVVTEGASGQMWIDNVRIAPLD